MRSRALGTRGGSLSCCLHYTVRWWMAAHGQPVSLRLLIRAPIQQEVRLRVPACSQTSPALGLGLNQDCAEETNTFSACSPFQMRKTSRVSRTGRGTCQPHATYFMNQFLKEQLLRTGLAAPYHFALIDLNLISFSVALFSSVYLCTNLEQCHGQPLELADGKNRKWCINNPSRDCRGEACAAFGDWLRSRQEHQLVNLPSLLQSH